MHWTTLSKRLAVSTIEAVDQIISCAYQNNASDIHLEPLNGDARIRYRIDGDLITVINLKLNFFKQLISRLKVLAHLDISEARRPQDGQIMLELDELGHLDIRASFCPSVLGEKSVLRLSKGGLSQLELSNLGLLATQLDCLKQQLNKKQGLILVTGPTGSGKSSTLYSALKYLNDGSRNILSVEDPVEVSISGIHQLQIKPEINLTFSSVLKAFLRQDPDVIMVGEIRDKATAQIALRAAQTGHLVLSSLHTANAVKALSRLNSLGIDLTMLANSLNLIVAQQLVKTYCPCCKGEPTNHSCGQCISGFWGRTGLFETLVLTDEMKQYIVKQSVNEQTIIKLAQKVGFISMYQVGKTKVRSGLTSERELVAIEG